MEYRSPQLTKPGRFGHNNPAYAFLDVNELAGLQVVNTILERDVIPLDKRAENMAVFVAGDQYTYISSDLSDVEWVKVSNWKSSKNSYVDTIADVSLLGSDNKFVLCDESGIMYHYVADGSNFIVDGLNVLNTADGGNTRFVSILLNDTIETELEVEVGVGGDFESMLDLYNYLQATPSIKRVTIDIISNYNLTGIFRFAYLDYFEFSDNGFNPTSTQNLRLSNIDEVNLYLTQTSTTNKLSVRVDYSNVVAISAKVIDYISIFSSNECSLTFSSTDVSNYVRISSVKSCLIINIYTLDLQIREASNVNVEGTGVISNITPYRANNVLCVASTTTVPILYENTKHFKNGSDSLMYTRGTNTFITNVDIPVVDLSGKADVDGSNLSDSDIYNFKTVLGLDNIHVIMDESDLTIPDNYYDLDIQYTTYLLNSNTSFIINAITFDPDDYVDKEFILYNKGESCTVNGITLNTNEKVTIFSNGIDWINIHEPIILPYTTLKTYQDFNTQSFISTTSDLTYYVSLTGDDNNNGLTELTAFATIDKALQTISFLYVNHTIEIIFGVGTHNIDPIHLSLYSSSIRCGVGKVIFTGTMIEEHTNVSIYDLTGRCNIRTLSGITVVPHDLQAMYVYDGNQYYYPIASNTDTEIYVSSTLLESSYNIYSLGTTFNYVDNSTFLDKDENSVFEFNRLILQTDSDTSFFLNYSNFIFNECNILSSIDSDILNKLEFVKFRRCNFIDYTTSNAKFIGINSVYLDECNLINSYSVDSSNLQIHANLIVMNSYIGNINSSKIDIFNLSNLNTCCSFINYDNNIYSGVIFNTKACNIYLGKVEVLGNVRFNLSSLEKWGSVSDSNINVEIYAFDNVEYPLTLILPTSISTIPPVDLSVGRNIYIQGQTETLISNLSSSSRVNIDNSNDKLSTDILHLNTDNTNDLTETGTLKWNIHDFTPEFKTPYHTGQVNQEQVFMARNHNAYELLNGRAIRIVGWNGEYYTIDYADNSILETADWDGILTCDIPAYTGTNDDEVIGVVTTNGFIRDINTSTYTINDDIYLGKNGNVTNIKPTSPDYIRIVGKAGIIGVNGSIYVRYCNDKIGDIDESLLNMNMPHGIPSTEKSKINMVYNVGTRTVTISGTFYYYFNSKKIIKNSFTYNAVHPNTIGEYFIYFDENDSVIITQTPWILGQTVPLSILYYNNSVASTFWTGTDGILLCERHGCIMDKATHINLHENIGCYARSGFALTGYVEATGNGGLANNSFAVDSGLIRDEDNYNTIPAITDNNGVGNNYQVYYKLGSVWNWYKTNLPYLITNNNILFNTITSGVGSLVQSTTNGRYVNIWVIATPVLNKTTGLISNDGIGFIIGQREYKSLALANSESFYELDLTGFSSEEIAPLYQITFRREGTYDTSGGRVRIESVRRIVGTKYVSGSMLTSSNIHNNLAGRNELACHPGSSITLDVTNFNLNLNNTDISVQNLADKFDDFNAVLTTTNQTITSGIKTFVEYPQKKVYEIGDVGPAGGVIALIDTSVTPNVYYELAPTSAGNFAFKTEQTVSSGTSTEIGTGKTNTVALSGTLHPAAEACRNYSVGGFDDWFLPSINELVGSLNNVAVTPAQRTALGIPVNSFLTWSSSDFNQQDAYIAFYTVVPSYVSLTDVDKNVAYSVRPMRSFTGGVPLPLNENEFITKSYSDNNGIILEHLNISSNTILSFGIFANYKIISVIIKNYGDAIQSLSIGTTYAGNDVVYKNTIPDNSTASDGITVCELSKSFFDKPTSLYVCDDSGSDLVDNLFDIKIKIEKVW